MSDFHLTLGDIAWLYLLLVIFIAFEAVTDGLKQATRRDFGLTSLVFVLNSAIIRPLADIGIGLLAVLIAPAFAGSLDTLPFWPAFAGTIFLMEFTFYWIHRWSHVGQKKGNALGWLWKIHRTHHSAAQLDTTVTVRQNIFWTILSPHTWYVALCVYLGLETEVALALGIMYVWNLVTHTNWRWDDALLKYPAFRALTHIIITPSLHHTHHGYGKDGKMYRNYALMFAFLDWAFGTLHIPEGRPSRYGVPGENPHWAEEAFFPLNLLVPKTRTDQAETS